MFKYEKMLEYPINIKSKDLKMAKLLVAQFGGPDGELGASLRYLSQRFTMPDDRGKALLSDIGCEELGHVEMICTMIRQLIKEASIDEIKKYNWESKSHFYKRVENFYDEILEKFKNKNILIVGHCGTLRMSSFYFNPPDTYINDIYYNLKFPTGTVLVYPNDKPFDKPLYRVYDYDETFKKEYEL